MKDLAFTSVCFGDAYCEQQIRLKKSILEIYPEANLNFYYNRLPSSSKSFADSLYGFKPAAINETQRLGFSKVIWLDPAMILMTKIDALLKYQVIAVKDDNKLHDLISEQCLAFYGLTREMIKTNDWHLVGGSLYYFDFQTPGGKMVFKKWMLAESNGLFGTQKQQSSEQINGHRNDETLMALAMYMSGIEPQPGAEVGYCNEVKPIFSKKHFK